jgi:hypothetical protein
MDEQQFDRLTKYFGFNGLSRRTIVGGVVGALGLASLGSADAKHKKHKHKK